MIRKYLEYMSNTYGRVDAIIITNKQGIIEYSAMFSYESNCLLTKKIIGKNILDAYPSVSFETSSHYRVIRSKKPIINEKQYVTDFTGKQYNLINCTFPIENDGDIIGTIELSIFDHEKNDNKENEFYTLDDIITQNKNMLSIKDKISKISKTNSYVLISGETGTGKELVAQAIHSHSDRINKPFVSINCSAIPISLQESTLFGTVKGSFTDAENKKGLFEQANEGTLFLDEINSMDKNLQSKILKVIEEKKVRPIGSEKSIDIDVRIVSAMNIDPKFAIQNDILRSDLYYRLCVVQINLPPLSIRKDDITILTKYFIDKYNDQMNKRVINVDRFVSRVFCEYDWPGNVRELKNAIESSFNISSGDYISLNDIPEYIIFDKKVFYNNKDNTTKNTPLIETMYNYEKELINNALVNSRNVTEAAKKLKITRQSLRYKIEKFNLK